MGIITENYTMGVQENVIYRLIPVKKNTLISAMIELHNEKGGLFLWIIQMFIKSRRRLLCGKRSAMVQGQQAEM